jgi:hypothetical protein
MGIDNQQMGSKKAELYYVKTRGIRYTEQEASDHGIKRVYNYTSELEFMNDEDIDGWVKGLYDPRHSEAVLVESAIKTINGVPLYIMTCIVFMSIEGCNLYYLRYQSDFKENKGFAHLLN